MRNIRVSIISAIIIAAIFASSVVAAYYLNTDFGSVNVQKVSIASEHGQVKGLLYSPRYATSANPQPAVLLTHGISGAKQFLSGISLELARNGIVALTIDLLGHGSSDGQVANGEEDPTFGASAAIRYLEEQTFVNSSQIGLAGHSLGAGVVRATAVAHGNIKAVVFIGGGFGSMVAGYAYGTLNSTFPENLLVAIGKYDVLFNLDELRTEVLPSVFGASGEVVSDIIYGSFTNGSARKLITPATTHLFEPIDPVVTSEAVEWFVRALKLGGSEDNQQGMATMTFVYRDLAILISLVTLFALVLSLSPFVLSFLSYGVEKHGGQAGTLPMPLSDWKVLAIWGGLSLILFFPMVFIGFAVNVPPVVFGASIAWWTLSVALAGLAVLVLLSRRSSLKSNIGSMVSMAFDTRGFATAIAMFIILYLLSVLAEAFLLLDLGIIAPFFRVLTPASRVSVFFVLIPFFLVYFLVEGMFLHVFRQPQPNKLGSSSTLELAKTVGLKVSPYLLVLFLQYLPLVLLGFQFFPGIAAFLNEFWWLLTPIFALSTVCSWWFYRTTSRIGTGVVFNALIFALIAAGLFPF